MRRDPNERRAVPRLIAREIERRGLTVTAAAGQLRITRPSLSNVINGRRALSIPLSLQLERAFGMNALRLLTRQLFDDVLTERRRIAQDAPKAAAGHPGPAKPE